MAASTSRAVIARLVDNHGPISYGALVELAYMELEHARLHRTIAALVKNGTLIETTKPGVNKRRSRYYDLNRNVDVAAS